MAVKVPLSASGVNVYVSDQAQVANVKEESHGALSQYPGNADFTPKRIAVALNIAGNTPVQIEVQLQAGESKMAYWFGGKWNLFGSKHGFKLEGGYAKASLTAWGDPPIGMG